MESKTIGEKDCSRIVRQPFLPMTEAYGRKSKGSEKMNQNSYVNAAVRKIQCSDKKKKEIKQQLLQDVKKGMEHGKSIHEVIGDLGTPEQIAEMWNKKVSEKV